MKKISLITLSLSIILSGCATAESGAVSTEEQADTSVVNAPSEVASSPSEAAEPSSAESTENSDDSADAQFIWPTATHEISAGLDSYEGHSGVDMISGLGSDVVAAADGTVLEAGFDNLGNGYYVLLDNGDGYQTLYAHMQEELAVAAGDSVTQGQVIGTEGDTGNVTGEQLHFEIHKDGEVVDPADYLQ